MWVYGLDWAGPGQRQVADACECGDEPSGFREMLGISCLAANQLAAQEGLCTVEKVSIAQLQLGSSEGSPLMVVDRNMQEQVKVILT